MKNLLSIILVLFAFVVSAQDTSPLPSATVKKLIAPNNPTFYYNTIDSALWVFKGETGWFRIAKYSDTKIRHIKNGLHLSGDTIKLGGVLIDDTTHIQLAGKMFLISDSTRYKIGRYFSIDSLTINAEIKRNANNHAELNLTESEIDYVSTTDSTETEIRGEPSDIYLQMHYYDNASNINYNSTADYYPNRINNWVEKNALVNEKSSTSDSETIRFISNYPTMPRVWKGTVQDLTGIKYRDIDSTSFQDSTLIPKYYLKDLLELYKLKNDSILLSGYFTQFDALLKKNISDSTGTTGYTRRDRLASELAKKQNNLTLTTNYNSGASTLISDVLNVPTYTLTGLGLGGSKITYSSAFTFSNDRDIVDKAYVDAVATGNLPKTPVEVATTGNITLSGEQTIDTYSAVTGNRVLVWVQSDASENGIYIVASGAWSRATDTDTWAELYKAYVAVINGSQSGASFVCTIPSSGTLETTDVTWVLYNLPSNITAGTGLTKTGNTISLNVASASGLGGIKIGAGFIMNGDTASVSTNYAPPSGSANYVQVSPASQQTGNINMSGTLLMGDRIRSDVGFSANTSGTYLNDILGVGGTSTIARFGHSGVSNGFTVEYDGSDMIYKMIDGSLKIVNGNGDGITWKYSDAFGASGIANIFDSGTDAGNRMIFKVNKASGVADTTMTLYGNGDASIKNTINTLGYKLSGTSLFLNKFRTGYMGTSGQIPIANGISSDFTWTTPTTAHIAASTNKNYVTDAQLTVIGNTSGTNTGDNATNSQYSSLVSNATHTGEVTGATALTIANDVVTNAKLANVATLTIKGRVTAATGDPEDLTVAQVRTLLSISNVDNTSDANKPISSATQTALNEKQDDLNGTGFVKATGTTISYDNSTYLTTEVDGSTTNELNSFMSWTDATNTVGIVDAGGTKSAVITGFLESEVDGSTTNEIQDLSLTGNTLLLSGDATPVDLSAYVNVAANLTYTPSATDGRVNSDTGTDATIPLVNSTDAGLMSPADKIKIDSDDDQAIANEGSLSVLAGTATTSIIHSNTAGSADVTIEASTGLAISELGDVITLTNTQVGLTDGSITYARLSDQLKGKSTVTSSIDFSASGSGELSISSNTTLSFSNMQTNKTFRLKLTVTGATTTITNPSYCHYIVGSQVVLGTGTYYIYFDCWNSASGSEDVLTNVVKLQ